MDPVMEPTPDFSFKDLFSHIVGDMARAVSTRDGENEQQKLTRSYAAVQTIMHFMPRDAIEAMLAGHCLMFHEAIVDGIRITLRGEQDKLRRATRANLVSLDKCFGENLARLERYRSRPSEGTRDEPEAEPVEARAETDIADRIVRHEARTSPTATKPSSAARAKNQPQPIGVSPEAIAACRANPGAMAALDAGDPAGFAIAMGVTQPSEEYLAAAAGRPDIFGPRPEVSGAANGGSRPR
jgi:hypothetical protein